MRELSVYYCPKCGHYAYYQLSRNAVCPKCDIAMTHLDMRYQEFIHLDYDERDELLSSEIIKKANCLTTRLSLPAKRANNRETVAALKNQILELETENQKLNETVEWMHQLIWDLLKKSKQSEQDPPEKNCGQLPK